MEKINLAAPAAADRPVAETGRLPAAAARRTVAARAQMFIRRAHLYLGLLLVPWVVLFGISGFLFNHTSTTFGGGTRELAQFSPAEARRITGFTPVEVAQLAADVVRQLNETTPDRPANYTLVDAGAAHLSANAGFTGRTTNGTINLALNLADGGAALTMQAGMLLKPTKPAFAEQPVKVPGVDFAALAGHAGALAKAAGVTVDGAMTPRTRGGPELRFVVQDGEGRRWNAVCDLAQGRLSGRAADDDTGLSFYTAVTRLHKTHHYPDRVGARFFWVLLADTLALTMVFWGVSGLIMWWQIKPARVLGVLAMSLAGAVAAVIFSGTLKDMSFGPTRARPDGGPVIEGEGGGPGMRAPGGVRRPGGGRDSHGSVSAGEGN